jgi:hypothetical protein
VSASDLSNVYVQGGTVNGTDSMWVRAKIVQNSMPFASTAGLFGYGNTIRHSQLALESVDNSYMLFTMRRGFVYLTAVVDWATRRVLERDVVRDDRDRVRLVRAHERVDIGVVRRGVVRDQRRLTVARRGSRRWSDCADERGPGDDRRNGPDEHEEQYPPVHAFSFPSEDGSRR